MAYADINADTTDLILSAAGANAAEQAWGIDVSMGALQKTQFAALMQVGVKSKKPIKLKLEFKGLHGQTANYQSRAPLGSLPGVQGGIPRVGLGEQAKINMWTMFQGVHWHGIKENRIAASQTVLGRGKFDTIAREGLKDYFGLLQSRQIEAKLLQRAQRRTTIYAGNKTSIASLGSADTFNPAMMQDISDRMVQNSATPLWVAKPKSGALNPITGFYISAASPLLADMERNSDYVTQLQQSRVRGDENELYFGGFPLFGGSMLDRYQLQFDTSNGPKGTLGAPRAFLGNNIGLLPTNDGVAATGGAALGGGTAANGALTDPLYFQLWPNAEFKQFEQIVLAADTSTTRYFLAEASDGTFGMYSYVVNNGNKLVLTGALRATNATSGKIDKTTVGSVVYNTGVWTSDKISLTNAIGDQIYPCNAKGQPYVMGYAFADDAMWSAFGTIDGETAMGKRTAVLGENINHNIATEIGLEMSWGVECPEDANGLQAGFMVIYGAWNPPGLPNIT